MTPLSFGNKKDSTINDCTPSKDDTRLVLPSSSSSSSSSSLRSRIYHYSTIAVVTTVLLATITVTAFSRTGSSSIITSSTTSSLHFNLVRGGVWRMWFFGNSKSLRRVSDLPMCTGVDPVISTAAATSAIIPLELLRKYTGTSPNLERFEFKDQTGLVDAVLNLPIPCSNSTFPDSAKWCNTKGRQMSRINIYGMCLQDSDPDYYYIKGVFTDTDTLTGACSLIRVSRNTPGTWTEYQTQSMSTNGGAIEWVYDDEDVGMRFKYSLCPDTVDDKNSVKTLGATFG